MRRLTSINHPLTTVNTANISSTHPSPPALRSSHARRHLHHRLRLCMFAKTSHDVIPLHRGFPHPTTEKSPPDSNAYQRKPNAYPLHVSAAYPHLPLRHKRSYPSTPRNPSGERIPRGRTSTGPPAAHSSHRDLANASVLRRASRHPSLRHKSVFAILAPVAAGPKNNSRFSNMSQHVATCQLPHNFPQVLTCCLTS